ncbi:hypothetical protein SOVF_074290 [Spinacia oleracea]|uniref:Uncharacterized protein n=1 Tax=Spinacia oleracea TaxID=3562 RepID=A0A9R0K0J3_SPIOL|nr:uncharacterized protein LOC110792844 [Spinacia oleracea]KNA18074.1 hypothetical protein SOVF_074290 [Spinacia oleracea]
MGVKKAEVLVKSTKRPPTPAPAPAPPPPPPPTRPRWSSYTRREIERFWRKRRLEEEEHFLAAIKASARLRATHLSEEEYLLFIENLEEDKTKEEDVNTIFQNKSYGNNQEIRVGIKDWWTKSKYAYLNEPSVGSVGRPSRRSNYKPESIIWFYKMSSPAATASAQALFLGVY